MLLQFLAALLFVQVPTTSPNAWMADSSATVVVREIHLNGNRRTKERIILRELDFRPGDTLRTDELSERLEKNRRKVFNTNLFVTVSARIDYLNAREIDVEFDLREQWYVLGFPVFQLADRNFNEWWYDRGRDLSRTIYGVNLRHRNVRGRAEELRLNLETGFASYVDVSYRIPYLDRKQKIGLTVGASYQTTKNLAYRTNLDKLVFLRSEQTLRDRVYANVVLRRRNKFYDFQYLELRYTTQTVADTIARLNPYYFLDSRTRQRFWLLSYTYLYDFRDKAQYPLRGHVWGANLTQWGLLPTDDVHQTEMTLNYYRFLPLGKRWFVSFVTEAKTSFPASQPFPQTRGLGYFGDLVRGYERYVVDGQSYAYLRNTLKFQALDRTFFLKPLRKIRQFNTLPLAIYPNVYADVGYADNRFTNRNNSRLANRLLFGGGVGLDFVTWYNVVIRLNYSINREGQRGFYFTAGREF
jgi:outer membrane protein assembly factor BamA